MARCHNNCAPASCNTDNQLCYRSLPAGPRGSPPSWKCSSTPSSSLGLCSATGRAQVRQKIPWLTGMWGRKRKTLDLTKDRRMTAFCLTDYGKLKILSAQEDQGGKPDHSRKHSLSVCKASQWTSGDLGSTLSSATTFPSMAEA